jgi:hypothetical protein
MDRVFIYRPAAAGKPEAARELGRKMRVPA